MNSEKILMTLCFDGKNFHGWQVQKNAPTVQGTLCATFEKMFGIYPDITGCSRTDAGVHANMFCCHMEKKGFDIENEALLRALNSYLPSDISVLDICGVDADFHARYSCKAKEYVYKIWNGRSKNPFLTDRALYVPQKIDEERCAFMPEVLCGKHDFRSFMAQGSKITDDTVRDIKYFDIKRSGDLLEIYVCADGFLYNMVRIMVGTFLDAAAGKITKQSLEEILCACDRKRASFTAAPHGLYLNRVFY